MRRQLSRPGLHGQGGMGTAQPTLHSGWDSLTGQGNTILTSREDQVVAVSFEQTSSGITRFLKHRRDRPSQLKPELSTLLQRLGGAGRSGGCSPFWDVLVPSKTYFCLLHVGILTIVVSPPYGFSAFPLCQPQLAYEMSAFDIGIVCFMCFSCCFCLKRSMFVISLPPHFIFSLWGKN